LFTNENYRTIYRKVKPSHKSMRKIFAFTFGNATRNINKTQSIKNPPKRVVVVCISPSHVELSIFGWLF